MKLVGLNKRPRSGRPPDREAAGRNEKLLDAATEVFMESGFGGASMNEIARRAGASKHTLYARYPTKAKLFSALMERKSSQVFHAIGPLSLETPIRETLVRFCTEILTMVLTDSAQCLHRIVIADCLDFPELGKAFWQFGPGRSRAVLAEYFRAQQAKGLVRLEHAEAAAELLHGMLVDTNSTRTNLGLRPLTKSRAEQKAWIHQVVDFFLTAYQPSTKR